MFCECEVTDEMLTEWGFPVEIRVHCVGAWHVKRAGMPRHRAMAEARRAGLVKVGCFHPAPEPEPLPTVDPEMMAFFLSIRREHA